MTTAENPVDNTRFETFPELHETPEEIAFELRAQEGALWTGGRLLIGIWAFASRRWRLRTSICARPTMRTSGGPKGSPHPPRPAGPSSP